MLQPVPEAYELVEDGLITTADFRDFTFSNAVRLWGTQNPRFFEGARIAKQASSPKRCTRPLIRRIMYDNVMHLRIALLKSASGLGKTERQSLCDPRGEAIGNVSHPFRDRFDRRLIGAGEKMIPKVNASTGADVRENPSKRRI
jgi:hypothetical protein